MENLLFNFDELGGKPEKQVKKVVAQFKKHGCLTNPELAVSVSHVKRSSGVSYREITFNFFDSQSATFLIKQSGDIFKVKVNGREMPIKNQHDHALAIAEIARKLEAGRQSFQAKMARAAKVVIPPKMTSTVKTREAQLQAKVDELTEAIAQADKEIAQLSA